MAGSSPDNSGTQIASEKTGVYEYDLFRAASLIAGGSLAIPAQQYGRVVGPIGRAVTVAAINPSGRGPKIN